MWRRIPDFTGCTLLLIRVLLWIFVVKHSQNQELPTHDVDYAFRINQKNLFYDNNRIPDGIEVSPYLYFNTTKKFFVVLESNIDRLEITVTPCASPIIWHVTHKPQRKRNQNYDIGKDVQSSVVGFHSVIDTKPALYTLSGEIAETLSIDYPTEGIFIIDITPTKSDSYVELFASTSPDIDRYPELPADTNLNKKELTDNSFKVSWDSSPDESHVGDDIEYCYAVNRKRSYKTLCSVLSHLNGDQKPTLPPGNGFGFADDVYKKRHLKQKAKPIKSENNGTIYFNCIGRETHFVYDKVTNAKGFFVDVFVRSKQSGKSRYFNGTYVKRKRKGAVDEIKEGKLKRVMFNKNKLKQAFTFAIKNSTKEVHLAINSCSGPTHLEVRTKNVTFHKSKIKDSKILTWKDISPGKYDLELSKTVPKKQNVYISLTTVANNVQLPVLPLDTTVQIFHYMTTCSSVTVAWMGTDKLQNYCLYKTELPLKKNSISVSQKLSHCGALSRKRLAQKITCKKFKFRNKERAVLAITVTGLKPDTAYMFDVFVNKSKHFSFPYKSVRTKTSTQCYLPT